MSKAAFKAQALELFRRVEATGETIVVTDRGRPVVQVGPFRGEDEAIVATLRESVLAYERPTDPVGEDDWEGLR